MAFNEQMKTITYNYYLTYFRHMTLNNKLLQILIVSILLLFRFRLDYN